MVHPENCECSHGVPPVNLMMKVLVWQPSAWPFVIVPVILKESLLGIKALEEKSWTAAIG